MNKSGNPVGLGLVIVGSITMAVAAFLPLTEPTGPFSQVGSNTLIQHGGWLLIVFAIAISASGYRVSQRDGKGWVTPTIQCVVAGAGILIVANDKGLRMLYPVGPDGTADTSLPGTVASLGIAVYVAGAGVAAALIGSLMLRQNAQQDSVGELGPANAATKECPDCAETVLAAANVCKHCGYRFAPAKTLAPAAELKPSPSVLARGVLVKVIAADESRGQIGIVHEIVDADEDGLDVLVTFKGDKGEYELAFSRDDLKIVTPKGKSQSKK